MVGIIKNLFSKKDNYYIQLEEEQGTEAGQQQTQSKVQQQGENQQFQPQSSTNTEQQQSQSEASTNTKQQQPQPQSSPSPLPQQPISFQSNGQSQAEQLKGDTFAPTHLIPKATTFRRRPGANMENFKELARQVNISSNQ